MTGSVHGGPRTIPDIKGILTPFLTSEWARQKTPYGITAALKAARSQPDDHTEQIFLKAGFQAWVAYYLAKHRSGNYVGRSAALSTIDAFDLLPREQREEVAASIAKIEPPESVADAIDAIGAISGIQDRMPSKKRRRGLSQYRVRIIRK
jgi:hypothetical protein